MFIFLRFALNFDKEKGKGERNQCTVHHCKEALHAFLLADKKLKPAAKPKLPPNLEQ